MQFTSKDFDASFWKELQKIVLQVLQDHLNKKDSPEVLDVEGAALYTKLSKRTLYRMASSHEIASVKLRNRLAFKKDDLDQYINSVRRKSDYELYQSS
ncbi:MULTISPECIES: helix-turn-helix domain-containing protein [unclassified Fibrobacter]|uniref:helix-turn-helix domain-containing protein n=1 Tax=unclassified Fibrobacter TaxID=2634177 RepID=UPI000922C845|nr:MULTISPECIES: helix-turn-helix domain-containing protein [unclassified Fibrobacter]SHK24335.1 DNA binding domain-containing protein, excisionase family [Fibrobacter sp. UWH6]SHK42279.1 DNA binding domain-containing protein, excisionase family [Fibrobacter sp. UWH5]